MMVRFLVRQCSFIIEFKWSLLIWNDGGHKLELKWLVAIHTCYLAIKNGQFMWMIQYRQSLAHKFFGLRLRKTIGARLTHGDEVMVATNTKQSEPSVYDAVDASSDVGVDAGDEEDMANLSADASQSPDAPVASPAQEVPKDVAVGYPSPKPRPKPIEVLMLAAASMDVNIQPANAPPPTEVNGAKPSVITNSIGVVEAAATMTDDAAPSQASNASGKGSFAEALRNGTTTDAPLMKPMMASASGSDINWWPQPYIFNPEQTVRRDGAPQQFTTNDNPLVPTAQAQPAQDAAPLVAPRIISASMQETASGKGDMLVVQRQGKGSLPSTLTELLQGLKKVGEL